MTRARSMVGTALLLCAGLVGTAAAGEGRFGRLGSRRARFARVLREERTHLRELVASLQVGEEQRHLVLEKARAAGPIVAGARDEARRAIADAWGQASKTDGGKIDRKALRESVRARIRAIRDRVAADLRPLAKDVVASLTPEQRQKIEEAAARRGRTLDGERLERFVGRLLSHRMTVPFLEAK